MNSTQIGELHDWLSQLQGLVQNKTCKSPAFLRPYHLATLALVLRSEKAAQVGIPDHLADYATRMHLWKAIGLQSPHGGRFENDETGRFLPVEPLRDRNVVDECSRRLAAITKHANLNEKSHSSLDISISELLDNCFAHAGLKTGLHGVACAQYWPRGNLAQIAIADRGMGIRSSLESAETLEVRSLAADRNCCELATEFGVTSKPSHHAGYGLALARQMIARNGGTLIVVSRQEWFLSRGDLLKNGNRGVNWPGTLIVCEFNTDRPISTAEVYASWPRQVRGYDDDDFDF